MKQRLILALLVACWLSAWTNLEATASHPISVTKAFLYVSRQDVTAKVEVFLEDLFLFHNLKPNDQDFLDPDRIREGVALHRVFLAERLVLRDVAGVRVEGRVTNVEFDLPAEGVPLAELMAHTLVFELQYELDAEPEFLTISQQFTDAEGVIPAEMQLTVKQENGGEPHISQLKPHEPDTVRFQWNSPPLSAEASEKEREAWIAKQKQDTLGITSYSSVYSFLYIEPYEVRHEILIPLLTLEESVLLARDDDDFLDLAEQQAARQQIEAYFMSGNPIEIDGQLLRPTVERCDFYGLDLKDFAQRSEPKPVSLINARVGIILSYLPETVPRKVRLTWDRFNSYVWSVNVVVFAFENTIKATLTRLGESNVYVWENPGYTTPRRLAEVPFEPQPVATWSLPLVSLACLTMIPAVALLFRRSGLKAGYFVGGAAVLVVAAGAAWPFVRWETSDPFAAPPALSQAEARRVFAQLHSNTYEAFTYRQEDAVYDGLAYSVEGSLLRDLYLQIRRGLEMQEQGGAVSRIKDIQLVSGAARPAPRNNGEPRGFQYECVWDVEGTVEHWGHIHQRTNRYEAVFTVEPRQDAWKITGMDIVDAKRVKFETSLRDSNSEKTE